VDHHESGRPRVSRGIGAPTAIATGRSRSSIPASRTDVVHVGLREPLEHPQLTTRVLALRATIPLRRRLFGCDFDLDTIEVNPAWGGTATRPSYQTRTGTARPLRRRTGDHRRVPRRGCREPARPQSKGHKTLLWVLAYVHQFPVDALKIDRAFVNAVADSSEASALIHTFVGLGQALGLSTLAEGIEDRRQLERLRDEQCETGQGYVFARPMSPEDVTVLLTAGLRTARG
jgi:hypothetical protein